MNHHHPAGTANNKAEAGKIMITVVGGKGRYDYEQIWVMIGVGWRDTAASRADIQELCYYDKN
jgi:hypothetical protein